MFAPRGSGGARNRHIHSVVPDVDIGGHCDMTRRRGRHTPAVGRGVVSAAGRRTDDPFFLYAEAARIARSGTTRKDPLPALAAALSATGWHSHARSDPSFDTLREDPRRARVFDDITLPDDGSTAMFDFLTSGEIRILREHGYTRWRELASVGGDTDARDRLVAGGMPARTVDLAGAIAHLCASIELRPYRSRETIGLGARHGNLLRRAGVTSVIDLATSSLADLRSRVERANRRPTGDIHPDRSDRYVTASVLHVDLPEWHQAAWDLAGPTTGDSTHRVSLLGATTDPDGSGTTAVVFVNPGRAPVAIDGWAIADRSTLLQPLAGVIDAESEVEVPVTLDLSGDSPGILVLTDNTGGTIDQVTYDVETLRLVGRTSFDRATPPH